MGHNPKKTFVIGTALPSNNPNDLRSQTIIDELHSQFDSSDLELIILDFNDITESARENFATNKLDIIIADTEAYNSNPYVLQLIENIKEDINNGIDPNLTFIHTYDETSSSEDKLIEITNKLAELVKKKDEDEGKDEIGIGLVPCDISDSDSYIRVAISAKTLATEKERTLLAEKEIIDLSTKVKDKMNEHEDSYTPEHLDRTCEIAVKIAEQMGLSDSDLKTLSLGASIHDLGKEFISVDLLRKIGKPTPEEREELESHVIYAEADISKYDFGEFEKIKNIIAQHHERCDGGGYPRGLSGFPKGTNLEEEKEKIEEINGNATIADIGKGDIDPLAEIVQVADSVHAMLGRIYHDEFKTIEDIKQELIDYGSIEPAEKEKEFTCQFNPYIANVLLRMIEKNLIDLEEYRPQAIKDALKQNTITSPPKENEDRKENEPMYEAPLTREQLKEAALTVRINEFEARISNLQEGDPKTKELQKEIEKTREEKNKLEKEIEIEKLKKEKNELKKEIEKLKEEKNELKKEIEKLKEEENELKKEEEIEEPKEGKPEPIKIKKEDVQVVAEQSDSIAISIRVGKEIKEIVHSQSLESSEHDKKSPEETTH